MDFTLFFNSTDEIINICNVPQNALNLFLCFLLGIMSVVTMCGNLLVIISIFYFRQLHTPTNYLVLSLAVADLLMGVIVLPLSILLFASPCWDHQEVISIVWGSFDIMFCVCSILSLCFISVDRYYAVCQPLSYRTKITDYVVAVMIVITWTISGLCGVIFTGLQEKYTLFHNLSYGVITSAFYIPVIAMFSIYVKIFFVAKRQARSIHSMHSGATVRKVERKATRTLAIVMGVFVVCWSPFFLCVTYLPFSNFEIPLSLMETLKWLGWSNSMLNPFIYAFFYGWFRSAFKMILTGKIFKGNFTNAKLL